LSQGRLAQPGDTQDVLLAIGQMHAQFCQSALCLDATVPKERNPLA